MIRPPKRPYRLAAAALAVAMVAIVAACGSSLQAQPAASAQSPSLAPSRASASTGCHTGGGKSTVAYASHPGIDPDLTSVDVYAPAGACGAPVVMWVHGGGYQVGDKANQVRDKVSLASKEGWVFVSVNYRLTTNDAAASAQFPDHYEDVASAVAWVHWNIGRYGGDAGRVALLGHSAGADIVANVTVNPQYLQRQGLDLSAVRCAGPLDTEGFDKVAGSAKDPDGEKEQWRGALGNNPDYLTATSTTTLIRPGAGIPPMIGVVRGTAQRRGIERAFLSTLRQAGIQATTIDATSLNHNEVNSRIGAAGDDVMTPPLTTFLRGCFQAP